MEFFIALIAFLLILTVLELLIYGFYLYSNPQIKKIRRRLTDLSEIDHFDQVEDITRKRVYSEIPLLHKLLANTPGIERLDRLLLQSNTQFSIGFFIVSTMTLSAVVGLALTFAFGSFMISLFGAAGAAMMPWLYLLHQRKKWTDRFREQLPDALELVARALRAGHAFTMGMQYAAEEYGRPLGPEFKYTLDEINFGVSVQQALKNMSTRVGCAELSFFCVSVILQRETGGNLADILDNLSTILRERFKLRGKIKALSAEGKLTAYILFAIPIFIAGASLLLNPDFITVLADDPRGRMMVVGSLLSMLLAAFIIRRMIRFHI